MSSSPDFLLNENKQFTQEDFPSFLNSFNETYLQIATQVNRKVFGYISTQQVMTGKQWFVDPQNYKMIYRKRFDFTTIAQGATETIAHGLSGFTKIVKRYGEVITAADYRPIPYMSVSNVNLGIEINNDSTNITIVNGAAAPAITSGFVVLEYIY